MGALRNSDNGYIGSQMAEITNESQWVKIKIVNDTEYQALLADPPTDNIIYLGKEA